MSRRAAIKGFILSLQIQGQHSKCYYEIVDLPEWPKFAGDAVRKFHLELLKIKGDIPCGVDRRDLWQLIKILALPEELSPGQAMHVVTALLACGAVVLHGAPLNPRLDKDRRYYLGETAFNKAMSTVERSIEVNRRHSANSLRTVFPGNSFGNNLRGEWCDKCNKNTPHKTASCLYCGFAPIPGRIPELAMGRKPDKQDRKKRKTWAKAIKINQWGKRREFREAAEESRQKFESKETPT